LRIYKILIKGDSDIGKSCLLWRVWGDKFKALSIATISLDLNLKVIILDISWQDRFVSVTKNYYRDTNGNLLVSDITDRTSLNHIKILKLFFLQSKPEFKLYYIITSFSGKKNHFIKDNKKIKSTFGPYKRSSISSIGRIKEQLLKINNSY
jgi:hypothetical protein